jgi:hypothetical protein
MKLNFFVNGWKMIYIYTPNECKFGYKCNGSCVKLKYNVNHPDQKYCLKINCTNPDCRLNHLLDWKGIRDQNYIKYISARDYASSIYSNYGDEFIRQIVIDNTNLFMRTTECELLKALELEIERHEHFTFETADPIRIKKILDKENDKLKKKMLKIEEQIISGKMMVKLYINIRNSGDVEEEYKNYIKNRFNNLRKFNIFKLIDEFVGPSIPISIPTFMDL